MRMLPAGNTETGKLNPSLKEKDSQLVENT
jgi:hypothetical protein